MIIIQIYFHYLKVFEDFFIMGFKIKLIFFYAFLFGKFLLLVGFVSLNFENFKIYLFYINFFLLNI